MTRRYEGGRLPVKEFKNIRFSGLQEVLSLVPNYAVDAFPPVVEVLLLVVTLLLGVSKLLLRLAYVLLGIIWRTFSKRISDCSSI